MCFSSGFSLCAGMLICSFDSFIFFLLNYFFPALLKYCFFVSRNNFMSDLTLTFVAHFCVNWIWMNLEESGARKLPRCISLPSCHLLGELTWGSWISEASWLCPLLVLSSFFPRPITPILLSSDSSPGWTLPRMRGLKSAGALLNSPGLMDWVKPHRAPVPSATQTLGAVNTLLSLGAERGRGCLLPCILYFMWGWGVGGSPHLEMAFMSFCLLLACYFVCFNVRIWGD